MKQGEKIVLDHSLKALRLTIMLSHYPSLVRQSRENGISYEEFLLSLTEVELRIRGENRLKRRIKEARFPLLKTFEVLPEHVPIQPDATPGYPQTGRD